MADETPYSKREQDTYREEVLASLDRIEKQVVYTNGKVRKIILAMVAMGFLLIGLGINQLAPIIALLL